MAGQPTAPKSATTSLKSEAERNFLTGCIAKTLKEHPEWANDPLVFIVPVFDDNGKEGPVFRQTKNPKYGQLMFMSIRNNGYNKFSGFEGDSVDYAWKTTTMAKLNAIWTKEEVAEGGFTSDLIGKKKASAGALVGGRIFRHDFTQSTAAEHNALPENANQLVNLTAYDYKYATAADRKAFLGKTKDAQPGMVTTDGEPIYQIKNWSPEESEMDVIIPGVRITTTSSSSNAILTAGQAKAAKSKVSF